MATGQEWRNLIASVPAAETAYQLNTAQGDIDCLAELNDPEGAKTLTDNGLRTESGTAILGYCDNRGMARQLSQQELDEFLGIMQRTANVWEQQGDQNLQDAAESVRSYLARFSTITGLDFADQNIRGLINQVFDYGSAAGTQQKYLDLGYTATSYAQDSFQEDATQATSIDTSRSWDATGYTATTLYPPEQTKLNEALTNSEQAGFDSYNAGDDATAVSRAQADVWVTYYPPTP